MGIFLIITLSTIFSGEYSQKTDSLLLSSKYGKSRLIHAKLIAAFLVTIGFWLIIQITNLLLVAGLFNLQGAHTFVQDWVFNNSPFPFTQLTNYLAVTFMSFIGILFFAAAILLISAKTKNPFISLLVSGVVLLFPVMGDVSTIEGFLGELSPFMPTQMLIATNHFIFFKAYYVFGNALLMQYAVPMVAIMLTGLMVLIAYRTFKQRQVEN
jgi:ABC-type transport system involved in multi-copper enzyme maturation permease subunit